MPRLWVAGAMLAVFISLSVHADVNEDLMKASEAGNIERVRELINAGADVDAKYENGFTALMSALF